MSSTPPGVFVLMVACRGREWPVESPAVPRVGEEIVFWDHQDKDREVHLVVERVEWNGTGASDAGANRLRPWLHCRDAVVVERPL